VRGPAIVGCAVVAAIATPTGDVLTMLAVAAPMVVMYEAAEIICRLRDRRLAGRAVLSPPGRDSQAVTAT
jgi:sec-independent protein translocase protein TatC